jgi:competence protein ComEC
MKLIRHYTRKYLLYISVLILFLLVIIGYYFFYPNIHSHTSNVLTVAFLDIGQGDAVYIEAPNGRQMLIDGGPGPILLSRLAAVMPFGDRSIDILMITNPDKDHMAGFVDVLDKFSVGLVLEPGTPKSTTIYKKIQDSIVNHNVKKLIVRRGMRILLDQEKNVYLDILFPDRDVSTWSANDGSIVAKLVYGKESFMLMGDATKYTEVLMHHNENPEILHANVLKLGHHGSHTSSSELWLEDVQPRFAIISAGLGNHYGHPHQDVLDRLYNLNIPYLATLGKGTILFETDGVSLKERQLKN